MRHTQRGVAHLAGLLAEDGAQQALLSGQLSLALRGDLCYICRPFAVGGFCRKIPVYYVRGYLANLTFVM